MIIRNLTISLLVLLISLAKSACFGQGVTAGIHYQAVARDNQGKELYNKTIDVKFSIISETPIGTIVYQELHSHVTTSKYGVFSLVIGKGTPTGGTYPALADVNWSIADHFLKVEVKFENDFIDMGTMQFLAVPYALYAQKSLEPGPAGPRGEPGPKGDAGDPASDNQTLSFDQNILTISEGNAVPLTSLLQSLTVTSSPEGNYLGISRGNSVLLTTAESDGDPKNEIQDLTFDGVTRKLSLLKSTAPAIDLSELKNDADADPVNEIQNLTWDPATRSLALSSQAGSVNLSELEDDADANPVNEIQDLNLSGNILTITNKTSPAQINLSTYIQSLTFTPADNKLQIGGGNTVDLTPLKDDADASPTNEIQDLSLSGNILTITNKTSPAQINLSTYIQSLTFTPADNKLQIGGGNTVDLTPLKDDADASPTNEIQDLNLSGNILTITNKTSPASISLAPYLDNTDNQTLSFNQLTNTLALTNGGSVSLGSMVAFRARKTSEETGSSAPGTDYDFITPSVDYNDGSAFNPGTGIFTVPSNGIYTFNIGYNAGGNGDIKTLKFYVNNILTEVLNTHIGSNSSLTRSITMKLLTGDKVKVTISILVGTQGSGTGSFSGYKVY